MVTAFAMLLGIPSTIIGGVIVQRKSWKKVAIFSSWLSICILLGYYFSNSWITLSIPILIAAFGTIGSTAWRLLVADTTVQKNRTAQLSIYQTLTTLPSIFFPLIGGYLVHVMGINEGFRYGILLAIAITPVSTLLMIKFLRDNSQNEQPKSRVTNPTLSQDITKHASKIEVNLSLNYPTSPQKNRKFGRSQSTVELILYLKDFYKNLISLPKLLIPLLAAYLLVILANSTTGSYLIFYATNIVKLDTFQWGIILSSQLLLANLIRTPLGIISDKFEKRKVLVFSAIITAPLSILLILQNSFLGILGISLAMIATGINYGPTHEALQIELTPREKRPALFSIFDVLTNLSRSIGTIIGAILFTISYFMPFYFFTIVEAGAAVILVLSFLYKGKNKTIAQPP